MSKNYKIVFTYKTSNDQNFNFTLPNVDQDASTANIRAAKDQILNTNIVMPKEGTLVSHEKTEKVETAVSEFQITA